MFLRFLSNNYPLEKHLFFVPRYSYSLLGLYFERPQSVWSLVWLLFNFVNLLHCCQAEFSFGWYYLLRSPVDAIDAFCPLACSLTTLFKLMCMWKSRAQVAALMRRIRRLTEQLNAEQHLRWKRHYYQLATRLGMLVLTMGSITTTAFVLRSLWEIYVNLSSDAPFRYEMPFRMFFPAFAHRLPFYPLAYMYSTWSGQVTVYAFAGTDGFFLSSTLYATFLLKALQADAQHILEAPSHDPGPQECERCCQRLSQIIDRHNEIAEIIADLSKIMAAPTFVHFLSASLVIATSVIAMLLYSGFNIIRYVVYACTVTNAIFQYSYGGTKMATASLNLGEMVYSSHWYRWNREVRKHVLLLLLRSQRPIMVQVPFFAPSLPVFMAVIKFTGSIVALVKTIL